ncbi:hypothetical protein EAO69_41800 [Streptomyces sp. me109]|nr:hypothetical protein EAO69_41800 [Streptomyces sp. me109]
MVARALSGRRTIAAFGSELRHEMTHRRRADEFDVRWGGRPLKTAEAARPVWLKAPDAAWT